MKKERYTGPFKVINLELNEPMNFMQEQMFVNAPIDEPWQVSTRRLLDTLRDMGESELRPMTIWLAYRTHKELSQHIGQPIEMKNK